MEIAETSMVEDTDTLRSRHATANRHASRATHGCWRAGSSCASQLILFLSVVIPRPRSSRAAVGIRNYFEKDSQRCRADGGTKQRPRRVDYEHGPARPRERTARWRQATARARRRKVTGRWRSPAEGRYADSRRSLGVRQPQHAHGRLLEVGVAYKLALECPNGADTLLRADGSRDPDILPAGRQSTLQRE